MNLLAISINHRTADVDQREALHLSEDEIRTLIEKAKENLLKEGLLISTCNRTELFGIPSDPAITHSNLKSFISNSKGSGVISSDIFHSFSRLVRESCHGERKEGQP